MIIMAIGSLSNNAPQALFSKIREYAKAQNFGSANVYWKDGVHEQGRGTYDATSGKHSGRTGVVELHISLDKSGLLKIVDKNGLKRDTVTWDRWDNESPIPFKDLPKQIEVKSLFSADANMAVEETAKGPAAGNDDANLMFMRDALSIVYHEHLEKSTLLKTKIYSHLDQTPLHTIESEITSTSGGATWGLKTYDDNFLSVRFENTRGDVNETDILILDSGDITTSINGKTERFFLPDRSDDRYTDERGVTYLKVLNTMIENVKIIAYGNSSLDGNLEAVEALKFLENIYKTADGLVKQR